MFALCSKLWKMTLCNFRNKKKTMFFYGKSNFTIWRNLNYPAWLLRVDYITIRSNLDAYNINYITVDSSSPVHLDPGEEAIITWHPHQVSISAESKFLCSGSVISEKFVLTTASCLSLGIPVEELYEVRSESSFPDMEGFVHRVTRAIKHESFSGFKADLGLLEVREPFMLSVVKPIDLFKSNQKFQNGSLAEFSGWGGNSMDIEFKKIFRVATMPLLERRSCNEAYAINGKELLRDQGSFCFGFDRKEETDSCCADIGSPVAIDGRLVGVVSRRLRCTETDYPGIVTEVAHFRHWIDEQITEEVWI